MSNKTMTIRQHLEQLNRGTDSHLECWVSIEEIARQVNIEWPGYDGELPELKCFFSPSYRWICTDTAVGLRFYFLGAECVCVSFQQARKSDEEFEWASPECYERVRSLILQKLAADMSVSPTMVNWDQELPVRTSA